MVRPVEKEGIAKVSGRLHAGKRFDDVLGDFVFVHGNGSELSWQAKDFDHSVAAIDNFKSKSAPPWLGVRRIGTSDMAYDLWVAVSIAGNKSPVREQIS